MLKSLMLVAAVGFLVVQQDCSDSQKPVASAVHRSVGRFVQVHSGGFGPFYLALDTQTGRLCKTYAWDDASNPTLIQGLPLCVDLYNEYSTEQIVPK